MANKAEIMRAALNEIGVSGHFIDGKFATTASEAISVGPHRMYQADCIAQQACGGRVMTFDEWRDKVTRINGHKPKFMDWINSEEAE